MTEKQETFEAGDVVVLKSDLATISNQQTYEVCLGRHEPLKMTVSNPKFITKDDVFLPEDTIVLCVYKKGESFAYSTFNSQCLTKRWKQPDQMIQKTAEVEVEVFIPLT
jgi:hypothetical protein